MTRTPEQEILTALRENQQAALRALAANDMVALRALAEQEARYMDELRAVWQTARVEKTACRDED